MHYTIIERDGYEYTSLKTDSPSPNIAEDLSTNNSVKMGPSSPNGGRKEVKDFEMAAQNGIEDQENVHLSREERRRRRRATSKYRNAHASRERTRVESFNVAFAELRVLLPTLPPDKKLSKIEILRLAICYISYMNHVLDLS